MIASWNAVWAIVVCIIGVCCAWWWDRFSSSCNPRFRGDVLLVFAHPDDEAMFFAPLLEYLRRINTRVHFLCLSTGNFAGMGAVREKELLKSARYFGLSTEHVRIVNESTLQDGMQEKWPSDVVARHVREVLQLHPTIRSVVTFDVKGVSGHPNHIDTSQGVALLRQQLAHEADRAPTIFLQLRTHSLLRKYSAIMSLFMSSLSRRSTSVSTTSADWTVAIRPGSVLSSLQGMQCHRSQLVWFRYLFVWFSSYTFVNEFNQL